jgi:hypothetical protein
MAYRLRYQVWVDWVPSGLGLGITASPGGPGAVPAGNAQTLEFFNSTSGVTTVAVGTAAAGTGLPPNANTFLAADVVAMTDAMAADIQTQMQVAATLARVQNFSTGTG